MKNAFLIILSVIVLASCDVINGEVRENVNTVIPIDTTGTDTTGNDTTVVPDFTKSVLIEEFTGHKCGNCPGAAREIFNYKTASSKKDNIVVIAVHAGSLAEPDPDFLPGTKFKYDFTTDVGDALDDEFGVNQAGVPRAVVSRKDYNGGILIQPFSISDAANQILNDGSESPVGITGTPSFNEGSNALTISVTSHFQETVAENVKLSVYVSEDSIINWQKNYAANGDPEYPAGDLDNYVHMHVFRGSMNGTYGTLLNSASGVSIDADAKIENPYSFVLTDHIAKNCNIIAFVYKESTLEVLQVKEWHMRDFMN